LPRGIGRTLRQGVELDDGPARADAFKLIDATPRTALVEITLHEGRNRIVRRMLEAVGHPVIDLVRRQFGPLHLGTLAPGEVRDLTKAGLGELLTISRDAQAAGTPSHGEPNTDTEDS
jgi:pseudouridine synthase